MMIQSSGNMRMRKGEAMCNASAMYITYRRKIMLAACWLMEVRGDGFKARPISMATMGILEDQY
jgi:hypothetical protein